MLGTRGVPARYGGFETCVEEIGKRLVERGHEVTVYCRAGYYREHPEKYLGMNLVYLPNVARKSFDTISHTLVSVAHALFGRYDVHMVFNAANSPFALPLRLVRKKVVINTDGLEWKRSKWGFWGKSYYRTCERVACRVADRLVCDSPGMADYYRQRHGAGSARISYGAYEQESTRPTRLAELGLEPNGYFLQITRFEPENNPLLTIQAFQRLTTDKRLVLVGGNPYPGEYTKTMRAAAGEKVVLPGFIYDQDLLRELWCCAFAYIHGNEVGGTNPALLQAMASGCFVIARNVPFNRTVLGDSGIYYEKSEASLCRQMDWSLRNEGMLSPFKEQSRKRIREQYSWDRVAAQYEALFFEVAGSPARSSSACGTSLELTEAAEGDSLGPIS